MVKETKQRVGNEFPVEIKIRINKEERFLNSLVLYFSMLWMSKRGLLYVMNVLKMYFVRFGCLKDVCMIRMSLRRLLYVANVSKTSFIHYGCL